MRDEGSGVAAGFEEAGADAPLTEGWEVGPSGRWSLAERTCLLSIGVIALLLLMIVLTLVARSQPDLLPFLDPLALGWHVRVSVLVTAGWVLVLLAAMRARHAGPEASWLAHFPIQLFAVSSAFNAYMLGIFTNPFGVLSLAGGLPVSLLAYGARSTWLGATSFVGLLGIATLGSQLGAIPYAPLMASSPVVAGRLAPAWVVGFGLMVVVGYSVLMFVSHRLVVEIRAREERLRGKHTQLFSIHEDLIQTRADLELSRDALEQRVGLRTRELRDSNEQLRAEIAMRSELSDDLEALRLVMEGAVEGIAWLRGDGLFEGVNGAYAEMHGTSADAMRGTHWKEWTHSEDWEAVSRGTAKLAEQHRQEVDFRGVRVDGSGFYGAAVLVEDLRKGEGHHFRFLRDVSRNRELGRQLTQASKMDAIGRLAGGVAHDFNNLLTAIVAAAEQLGGCPELEKGSTEAQELLGWIQTSAQRGSYLTRQLLDFSRPQSEDWEVLDVNDALRGVIGILGPALGTHIRVRERLGSGPLPVLGSASRLEASLMNLALNARDAMPDGGEILFSTGLEEIVEPEVRFAGFPMVPGGYARIEVRDRGTGIPDEMIGKVFEPFFTTKAPGEGSGLGLPLLYNFVSEMRGAVSIESLAGRGTQVCVLLPLVDLESAASAPSTCRGSECAGGTVLVAEDEDIVRQVLVKLLQTLGFEVIDCADGEEALREYAAHEPRIDLVLMDVRMPVRGGIDTLRVLRRADSPVPVILMSGNLSLSELESLEDRDYLGKLSVLNKPFGRPELAKAIGEAMAGA